MNITKENVDNLNARVTIKLEPTDYRPQVEKVLKEHARKANMPGFRPGKVPVGIIRKMYGTSVLVEEVNKMIANRLYKYIGEEKLDILGNPLPSEAVPPKAVWDEQSDLEFTYDLGLAPDVQLDLGRKFKFDQYIIEPTEKDIESSLENISKRSGEMVEHDTVAETDLLKVLWVELDGEGIKEKGVMNSSSVSMDGLKDDLKKELIGKHVNDTLEVNYRDFSDNETDLAAMLAVKQEELTEISEKFRITIEKIQRLKPAELNEELFAKLHPDGSVKTLDDLKEKIKKDYADYFAKESDRKLKNDIVLKLLADTKLSLPDEFLKRWMLTTGENKSSKEDIEKEYPQYSDSLRWQLIENKVIKDFGISVTEDELRNAVRAHLLQQFAYYGMQQADDKMMDDMVEKFMKREDEVRKVNDELFDIKVLALFKEKATLKEKRMNSEKFYVEIGKEAS